MANKPVLRFPLNGIHRGKTIFVVGAGPQLAGLRKDTLKQLNSMITIGVNKTFFMVKLKYFLSAYIGEILLATQQTDKTTILHMREKYEPPLVQNVVPLKRIMFEPGMELTSELDALCPTLMTRLNVALGATHLAYVMGARRIVFVGVEQRDRLHFWNFDEAARQKIVAALTKRGDPQILTIDHSYATLERDLTALSMSPNECMGPFFQIDHTPTFRAYFDLLLRGGVEVIATTTESVVADAGARVLPLEQILAAIGNEDIITEPDRLSDNPGI